MKRKKLSRFEFAILQSIQPEKAKGFKPYTEHEETQQRTNKIKNTFARFRAKSLKRKEKP